MTDPTANLLRFGEVLEWTGLSERTLSDIAAGGTIGGRALYAGGRRYFLRGVCAHVLLGHPLSSLPFGPEPEGELLRVCDVLGWTGLHEKQFRWAERHGLGGGRAITPGGKKLYPRVLIRAQFFTPLLPSGWRQTSNLPLPTPNLQSVPVYARS